MTAIRDRIESPIAKQEIHEVLMRYARGVNRADSELLRSCCRPGAIEEHGSTWSGPAMEYIDGATDWNHDTPSGEGCCPGLFDPSDPRKGMGRKDRDDFSYQRF